MSETSSKLDPICHDPEMAQQAMTTQELNLHCFPPDFSVVKSFAVFTDAALQTNGVSDTTLQTLSELQKKSETFAAKVATQTMSRTGRSLQRWEFDSDSSTELKRFRLVTGSIPILSDGRIMLVSSNKRPEWILPKGGWEQDESLEESAIRESFEEAGIVGILGPPMQTVCYETRKARVYRLSRAPSPNLEEIKAKPFFCPESQMGQLSADTGDSQSIHSNNSFTSSAAEGATVITPGKDMSADSSVPYTHVRMTLFPLYVTNTMATWPESGRLRRALPIDEAIDALAPRPEFQSLLREVKRQNLHLIQHGGTGTAA